MSSQTLRAEFLRQVGDFAPFLRLLDLLPDVAIFVKDQRGRFVLKNRRGFECCGGLEESQVVGHTDADVFPPELARTYVEQDRQVMNTGEPIINALCPSPEPGSQGLIAYSKFPLRNKAGKVIGLVGLHREIRGSRVTPPMFSRISMAVETIQKEFASPLTISHLAKIAGLSRSQFDRQFQRLFGSTPRDYLLRVRVQAARQLLVETEMKTTEVAIQCGFYDHSHLCRMFLRIAGVSPSVYRAQHQQTPSRSRVSKTNPRS